MKNKSLTGVFYTNDPFKCVTKHMCESFHPHSISWNGY